MLNGDTLDYIADMLVVICVPIYLVLDIYFKYHVLRNRDRRQ
jgi:phosphatidylglycerophosphate synthase